MRIWLTRLFTLLTLTALSLSVSSQVLASGLTTSSSDSAGQVKLNTQNGVYYLDTSTNPGGVIATSSGTTRNWLLSGVDIIVPKGFAQDFETLFNSVLSFVMVIATLLVFMFLIWGAFNWITSGGDKAKVDAARQKLVAAVVGLIIVAASYAILLLAIQFLGFTSLNDVFDQTRTIDQASQN